MSLDFFGYMGGIFQELDVAVGLISSLYAYKLFISSFIQKFFRRKIKSYKNVFNENLF
jgi:hypothetical protein